ncbi:precorrin-6A reductase [Treponema sp.]|uniref:precorrin-6A reductase n=1 Tax=Treponema sp. TaxID=166 RepID=UPI00388FCDC6
MKPVFIFAGTTEGRKLAEIFSKADFDCTVSVATEYGKNLLPEGSNINILQGRMDSDKMAEKFSKKDYAFIIDATHPFATEVSKEIKKACHKAGKEYIRFSRDTDDSITASVKATKNESDILYFETFEQAALYLKGKSGKIFVTTGSKNLPLLTDIISDKSRLFVRVLPSSESLKICMDCGILQKQIIAMQGPFSERANECQFNESGAEFLLTKESGMAGGYFEKISAAKKLSMKIIVVKNPEK